MNKWIAKFAMLAVVVSLLIVVGSCQKPADKSVTLKVLYYIDATQAGYAEDKKIWDDFKTANPNIKLEIEELFNEPFHQKTEAYVAGNNLPDVLFMWPSGRSTSLHQQKLTKDLSKILDPAMLADFSAAAINPANQANNYLAMLPQSFTYTTVMYANTKLLADNGLAVPKTYEDLKAMVPVLNAKGIQTVLMANKDTWVMQSCLFSTVSGRLAGDAFINKVKAGEAKFTDAPFVNALNFIQTMYKDGVLSKDTIQTGYGEVPALFASGKAAFLIDGDWRAGAFITDKASGTALIAPAAQDAEFAMIPFPAIPGEVNAGAVSAIAGTGFGISTAVKDESPVAAAAKLLVEYLYSKPVQTVRLETGAYIPSRNGITSDKVEPFINKIGAYKNALPVTTFVLDGALDASVYEPINTGLQEIGLGTKTPAQVAEAAQTAMDAFRSK